MTERKPTLAHAENSIGAGLLKALLDEVARLRQPWQNTAQAEQQQVIERLRNAVEQHVSIGVRKVAAIGFTAYAGELNSMAVKDGIKLSVMLHKGVARTDELLDHVGAAVLVVLADSTEYLEGMEKIKAQADQPELPLDPNAASGEPGAPVESAAPPTDGGDVEPAEQPVIPSLPEGGEVSTARGATEADQTVPGDHPAQDL